MAKKGMLLVLMNPPPAFEEEFNAWYDTEHVPERLAVPGVLTGRRFISTGASPRFMAIYDLETLSVLESPAYLAVAHDRFTPWTKRVTARARVQRHAGELVWPGDGITGRAPRATLLRFRGVPGDAVEAVTAGLRACFEGRPGVRQLRIVVDPAGPEGIDVLGVVEARVPLAEPLELSALGAAADLLDLVNTYTPF